MKEWLPEPPAFRLCEYCPDRMAPAASARYGGRVVQGNSSAAFIGLDGGDRA
jgi:hypothetical protein